MQHEPAAWRHGHVAWICRIDRQRICSMNMHHGHEAWTSSMNMLNKLSMDMQHGCAACTCSVTCSHAA
jgi:hypothetical protein